MRLGGCQGLRGGRQENPRRGRSWRNKGKSVRLVRGKRGLVKLGVLGKYVGQFVISAIYSVREFF